MKVVFPKIIIPKIIQWDNLIQHGWIKPKTNHFSECNKEHDFEGNKCKRCPKVLNKCKTHVFKTSDCDLCNE